jgi:hypothetical protein
VALAQPIPRPPRWTDKHQGLIEEFTAWIGDNDLRTETIQHVWVNFSNEEKHIGALGYWLKRNIQDAFFRNQVWGKEWTTHHDQFMGWCTSWITDPEIQDCVIASLRVALLERKVPPKQPSYWIRRIINPAFREECKKRSIPQANQWTEDTYKKALALAALQGIPKDIRDSVVSRVWRKLTIAVEPIGDLEHWMNNVISTEFASEIKEATRDNGYEWPVLKQVHGTKDDVDRALRAEENKESWKAKLLDQGDIELEETGPSYPMKQDNVILLDKLFQEHKKRNGVLGELSIVIMWLSSDDVGYTYSELGQHFRTSPDEIDAFVQHDYADVTRIAKERGIL